MGYAAADDWAVASRFPGRHDVTYFVCNSLPTEVRRREQDALTARYRAGLEAAGPTLDAIVDFDVLGLLVERGIAAS